MSSKIRNTENLMCCQNKITQNVFFIIFLGVILFLNILSVRHKTLTYDERSHFKYGLQILKLNSDRFKDCEGTMPFSAFNAIPHEIGELLKHVVKSGKFTNFLCTIEAGRYITIIFSLLLAFYVFKWTRELYGIIPGLFSLLLYMFSPNIIAHSQLVTLDLYTACMTTISSYYFWQFIKFSGWKRAVLTAIVLGLTQLTKFTCVFLYPIFTFIILGKYSGDLLRLIRAKNHKGFVKRLMPFFKFALFFVWVSILIINIGFLFNKTFTPLGEYKFKSDLFKSVQSNFMVLKNLQVPLPSPYVEGPDWHIFHEKSGGWQHGNLYLFGELRRGTGFNGYYFYAFLFKEPIPIQIFVLSSFVVYLLRYKKYNFLEDEVFLLCPIIFFTIYFNFFFTMHIGIRNFIVVLPFFYIFCGSLLKDWAAFSLKLKIPIVFLIIYLIISVLSYFPHYLSYFNELVRDRKNAYKILADSNIDWGQNGWYLQQYKKKYPNIQISPKYPVAGRIVVSVNDLVGVFNPGKYKWLIDNFEPIDHVAYSYLVYDISAEALEKIR